MSEEGTILPLHLLLVLVSNEYKYTRDSVSSAIQTPGISSKYYSATRRISLLGVWISMFGNTVSRV